MKHRTKIALLTCFLVSGVLSVASSFSLFAHIDDPLEIEIVGDPSTPDEPTYLYAYVPSGWGDNVYSYFNNESAGWPGNAMIQDETDPRLFKIDINGLTTDSDVIITNNNGFQSTSIPVDLSDLSTKGNLVYVHGDATGEQTSYNGSTVVEPTLEYKDIYIEYPWTWDEKDKITLTIKDDSGTWYTAITATKESVENRQVFKAHVNKLALEQGTLAENIWYKGTGDNESHDGDTQFIVVSELLTKNHIFINNDYVGTGEDIGNTVTLGDYSSIAGDPITIYAKMEHDWRNADGAAIGIHYWGGTDVSDTSWPGQRMTQVGGETNIWYFEFTVPEIKALTGIVLVRVSGSGDIADWGAKTPDIIENSPMGSINKLKDGTSNMIEITQTETAYNGALSSYTLSEYIEK